MATPEEKALSRVEACYNNQDEKLDLRWLGLSELPAEVFKLQNLSSLYLRGNQLSELSAEICQLQNLSSLDLGENQLSELPAEIGKLQNLSSLDLRGNQLSELSAEICQLQNLSSLYLGRNQLSELPAKICQLQNLSSLSLNGNQLSELPAEICQLQNLSSLSLNGNQLSELPAEIGKLQNLSSLDLEGNQLSELSAEICQLQNLSSLDLGGNQLKKLPAEIGKLQNLALFYLNGNMLNFFPLQIKQLPNFSKLALNKNKLKILPREILQLNLKITWKLENELKDGEITLRDNPLVDPPIEIIKQGNKAIVAYFVEKKQKPLNEVKVLLVGDGSAGKTSLLRRLVGQEFNSKESQTHGINIKPFQINVKEREVTLNYWDFGGQEIMHHTHQFFLSKRSLYILVLDGRKEEEPEYWLDYIQTLGGDSPVLIALNKIDQNASFEVNRADLRRKYPNIYDFFRISCQNNQGIDALREELYEAIFEVEMLSTFWPASWFAVKQALERLKKPFINEAEYIELCNQKKVMTESQDILVEFLDQLGIVLHFNQLDLRNVHVLEPHWVTEAVYRIINHKWLAKSSGVLNLDDLPELLKKPKRKKSARDYPRKVYYYIITLMKEFELCYELNKQQLLVPDLLPVEESALEFEENNALRFIFQYQFMPRSIMPRFIVRRHKEIKNGWQWRTGVVLYDDKTGAEAVVRSDKKNRKIDIMVNGQQKRDYFAVIRNTLWDIHKSFEVDKLGIEEHIPLPGFPNHTVEYAELIGLELSGKTTYTVGKLGGKDFAVAELLSGVESQAVRTARLKTQAGDTYIQHYHQYRDNFTGVKIVNQSKTNQTSNFTISDISDNSGNITGVGINEGNITQTVTTNPEHQELQILVAELKTAIETADIDPAQKIALQSQLPALEHPKDKTAIAAALSVIETLANTLKNAEKILASATKIGQFINSTSGF